MKVSNILVGGVFFALGLIMCIAASRLPTPRHMAFGPGFFPSIVGGGMILVGLGIGWQGYRERARAAWVVPPAWAATTRGWMRFWGLILSTVFYALVSRTFGFTITAAIIVSALLLIARVKPVKAVGVGIITAIILTFLFASLLKVPLPWGPFLSISGYLIW